MKRTPFKPKSDRPSRADRPKGGGLTRTTGLSLSSGPKGGRGLNSTPALPPWEVEKKARQKAALNALKRARRSAEQTGVTLSEWEDEFLDSLSERIKEHGRAFADPELGTPDQALSALQGRKLKEITKKAKGETPPRRGRSLPVRHLDKPDED